MSDFDTIKIDMIRKTVPAMIAGSIMSVQPMQDDLITNIMKMKIMKHREPEQGERIHSFIYGFQRYYGTEWIPELLWIDLRVKGL